MSGAQLKNIIKKEVRTTLNENRTPDNFLTKTNGKGLWTDESRKIVIRELELDIKSAIKWKESEDQLYGELRAYFGRNGWDVTKHGLIYTDPMWIRDLRVKLRSFGFTPSETKNIDYSEQGMQAEDYVSLDAGAKFIAGWKRVFGTYNLLGVDATS